MTTLVLVGNAKQPFERLLSAVLDNIPALPKPIVVQQGNTPFDDPRCERHSFLARDQVATIMSKSSVVICHAGAGTVLDAIRAGLTPIVVARRRSLGEHIDDHQVEFAAALQESGKATVAHDAPSLGAAIARALLQGRRSVEQNPEPPLVAKVREVLRAAERAAAENVR